MSKTTESDEYPKTVLKWVEANGVTYRIQVSPRPGSEHWNVTTDARHQGSDGWFRVEGKEARRKPDF